jgi:hypothetical protein
MYYIIILGIIVVALGTYYFFKKNTEGFQDTSGNMVTESDLNGVIRDLSGNLFKDTEGNHLLITQEHVDYIATNAEEPLHPATESLLKYAEENPDTRPVTDPGRQCDEILKQYTAMVDKSQYYRDAGDWKTYRVVLQSLANIQTQLNTMGCSDSPSVSVSDTTK